MYKKVFLLLLIFTQTVLTLSADDFTIKLQRDLQHVIDSLDTVLDTTKNHRLRMRAYEEAIYQLRKTDITRSLDYFDRGMQEAEAKNDTVSMGYLLYYSTLTYTDFGLYNNAIKNAYRMLELDEFLEKEDDGYALVYNILSVIYGKLNQVDMHEAMLRNALKYTPDTTSVKAVILLNMATSYLDRGMMDSTKVYLNKTRNFMETLGDSTHYVGLALAEIEVSMEEGNLNKAEEQLEELRPIVHDSPYATDATNYHVLAGEVDYLNRNYWDAVHHTDSSFIHIKDEFNYDLYYKNYLLRNKAFVKMGMFDTASKVLIEYVDSLDEYYTTFRSRNLQSINARYELEKDQYKKKVDELASEKRRSNFLLLSSFFGLILFAIIGYAFLQKQTNNKLLKEKNEELLAINKRFTEFLEQSSEGFWLADSKGNIILWNKTISALTGIEGPEVIGRNVRDVMYEIRARKTPRFIGERPVLELVIELLEEKDFEPVKYDYEVRLENETRFVEFVAFPISLEYKYYIGAIVNDITNSKIYEKDLVAAKEIAERSDKMKTEFLAQMSHEIRSPLNVIISFTSLIEMELSNKLTDDQRESFRSIQRAGKRIIRTIDMLLNMSELLVGSYEYNPTQVDLCKDVIPQLVYDYTPLAQTKGLELKVEDHSDGCRVIGDEYAVQQTFENLISNAVKYTQKGHIIIRTATDEEKRTYVEIEDTGIGISEEYIGNLFNPFTQEEQGYTRTYEGNGLGLALVKKYCEINNADVSVRSEKGKGSIFRVTFLN